MVEENGRPPDGGRCHWPRPRRHTPPGEVLPIWHAVPSHVLRLILVGPVVNAYTHWSGSRTVPCVGRVYGCQWCGDQAPCYHAYVGAWSAVAGPRPYWRRGRCVCELTPAARLDCPRLGLPLEAILGRTLVVSRCGPKLRSRATCAFDDSPAAPRAAGVSVDTRGVLLRVWSSGPQAVAVDAAARMLDECQSLQIDEE